jgi:hypothetical protein
MEKSKTNPFLVFIYATIEFFTLCALGLGALIVLIFSGIFIGSLYIRNLFRKNCCKYNSGSND